MNHLGDTNKMVSDTPRMNAARNAAMEHMTGDVWRVGCQLERELNAANERIKRLEEALTEIELAMKQPALNHRLMQIAGPARQVINIIKKAKEDNL